MDKRLAILNACMWGAIGAIIFVVVVTVAADLYLPLKDLLKGIFSHHWVGKGILAVLVFGACSLVTFPFSLNASAQRTTKHLTYLFGVSVAGALSLFIFFVYEAFLK